MVQGQIRRAEADKLLVRLESELKLRGGMGELVVQILTDRYKRPDLRRVPRQRIGRPPKVSA